METLERKSGHTGFEVENVGGIDETSVEIPPGVTILAGENATNRTSFLQAIMAAMGSDQATLKGDADKGRVRLEFEGDVYERRLTRVGDGVRFEGDTYLDDAEVANLFAFLLETNEGRLAVNRGDDLRKIIMRPVDIEALKRDIERLEGEKSKIKDEIATIESRKTDLPKLEQRRTELRNQIEEKRDELSDFEAEIEEHSSDIKESQKEQEELDEKLDQLRSTRADLESVRQNIEKQQDAISSLKQEQTEIEEELAELPESPTDEYDGLEHDIDRLRRERQSLSAEVSDLQSLIQYNEERLEEEDYDVLEALEDGEETDAESAITDQLVADKQESVVCWTCGSTVDREQIEDTIGRLQDLRSQKATELNEVNDELEELKSEQREAKQRQRRRQELEQKLEDIDEELERRENQLASLRDRREELTTNVEALEEEVNELESGDFDEILDLHKQANQLEFEIESLESDLDDVFDEIEEIEAMVEREDDLRAKHENLLDELKDRRTKVDQIEQEAVEEFNHHMDAILEILEYENIERIWIERVDQTVRDGRQKIEQTAFDLHVVRTTENGTAYEDTSDHLSESEREVTGLIFALAGYLVHDLHEDVPFMLLDSLEAIDADRIASLVDYFADYADYLVVALLEDDARALDDDYHRITEI